MYSLASTSTSKARQRVSIFPYFNISQNFIQNVQKQKKTSVLSCLINCNYNKISSVLKKSKNIDFNCIYMYDHMHEIQRKCIVLLPIMLQLDLIKFMQIEAKMCIRINLCWIAERISSCFFLFLATSPFISTTKVVITIV